jgi:hypothetical protein
MSDDNRNEKEKGKEVQDGNHMKKFSKMMLLVLSFGVFVVALSFFLPSKPVKAATDPVSIPVNVTNTSLPVSEVGTPFVTTLCLTTTSTTCSTGYTVPSTNHLVIEFTSGNCALAGTAAGSSESVSGPDLGVTTGGVTTNHFVAPFFTTQSNSGVSDLQINWAQQTRIYADPGTLVLFSTSSLETGGGGIVSCQETISGRLTTP